MLSDTIKAALWEELRFAKRQQWTITAAVIAFIVGAYTVVKPLGDWEKVGSTILVVAAVGGGIYWLWDLQHHLRNTRLAIDRYDPKPLWRGGELVSGMAGVMILSAAAVCYLLLWRDRAYHLLLRICSVLINLAMLPMGF